MWQGDLAKGQRTRIMGEINKGKISSILNKLLRIWSP